ncbi:four-helix bundle copper-binding protein [Streptomonospora nanhaiensis]|uniref:Ferredoxin n=1 Tax=Streptomonospora nanhaiensis TaxID=1323731 RepID=A0A853BF56_9ACTN|nr:four-helix bundle copper-binding protein [Streptomonospora nanhaiensis]MBV2364444.1 four-helix bundle copper-binding protein [Streptomonospora nanhaiensis]NYI94078.1 hypothetical protein [Streptomonospora nanhaiensis]
MPTQTEEFLRTHPRDVGGDVDLVKTAVERLAACAQACTACADACLGEPRVAELAACIRLDLDCAQVCEATESVLTRRTEPNRALQRSLVETCVLYCEACARECERHAAHHRHCRLCAETCRMCEDACRQLLVHL